MSDKNIDDRAPIFAIQAAAELAGMHPQTLRQYDRLGLVVPARTKGGSRRYSTSDILQLREVGRLSADGMSLPAIARIVELEMRVRELHSRVQELESRMQQELDRRPGARVFAAAATGSVVTLRSGTRMRRATEMVVWHPRRQLSRHDAGTAAAATRPSAPSPGGSCGCTDSPGPRPSPPTRRSTAASPAAERAGAEAMTVLGVGPSAGHGSRMR